MCIWPFKGNVHNHPDDLVFASNSYEEARPQSSRMSTSKDATASADGDLPARKRLCTGFEFRESQDMIKVIVGVSKANFVVHKDLLLAHSGYANILLKHDSTEKSTGTIAMIDDEADPGAFEIFVKYLYTQALDAVALGLDELILGYVLADYVDCAQFADLIFTEIYFRTTPLPTPYTAEQICFILSHTLADQPLRILLLEQICARMDQNSYDFNSRDREILSPFTGDILWAVMKAKKQKGARSSSIIGKPDRDFPIDRYLTHVSRHLSSKDVPHSAKRAKPFQKTKVEDVELVIGRKTIELVVQRAHVTKEKAMQALTENGYDVAPSTASLRLRARNVVRSAMALSVASPSSSASTSGPSFQPTAPSGNTPATPTPLNPG